MTWTTRPRSDFGALRAIIAGDGPTVLFIHGVGLRAEAWNAQIDAMSERFRVVAVDMPGHGESPPPGEDLNLSDYTDAIAQGLEAPALVIGHSMGAMIALDMAMRHPHLVRGVVAMNAIFQRDHAASKAVQTRARSLDGVTVAGPSGPLTRWFGDAPSPEQSACQRWLTSVDPAGYRMAYTVFAHENGPRPSALAALTCPALFVTGQDEPNSTPAMSKAMANLAPKGRTQIIEGAAHMMPMTHVAQVNAALLDFAQEITT
ncbi:alpha/beta fold hydrolase [Yoonia sediminilitoris]|uniref:Pimeloyl-ACP methyl ester carboxylesterase n=1 Tax=Yoonia sediminilitoris TaxID=1286148 RepID=A0A2T6KG09_9RHOB|nr:alpha/beta hydrolase [Yoonia sediminilitoris]PUB14269.1 pimeloyl-ACP methyl ester carboxylesterase [Yoonia sediminilitoris]RCW95200.1 pimeloyl-ACP methyl ester carboxylesterase [Yoonia sediminilitoris]